MIQDETLGSSSPGEQMIQDETWGSSTPGEQMKLWALLHRENG